MFYHQKTQFKHLFGLPHLYADIHKIIDTIILMFLISFRIKKTIRTQCFHFYIGWGHEQNSPFSLGFWPQNLLFMHPQSSEN